MRASRSTTLRAALAAAALTVAAAAATWRDVEIKGEGDRYTTRSDCAFGRCGEKLCLLGGRPLGTAPKPSSVFDTKDRKWVDRDAPTLALHHFQLAADPEDEGGDCVWAGGAFQAYYPNEEVVDRVYKFCAGSGKWSDGPTIARPRGAGGAVTYKGKYFLVAGNVGGHGEQAEVKAWFDVYDPRTKEWTELADVPHPRDHFSAAVLGDKLYVAGGRDTGVADFFNAVEPAVDVYDFGTKNWTTLGATFPSPRGGTLASLHGDRIAYGGGEGKGMAYGDFHLFDGTAFTQGPDLLTPHHGTGFASCNGALWVAGGVSDQGGKPEVASTEVYSYGSKVPVCTKDTFESPETTQGGLLDVEPNAPEVDEKSSRRESKCFPGSARVELESGSTVAMSALRVGDRVRVSGGSFSDVFFFSHRDADAVSAFVRITTHTTSLSLTHGHLLYVNGKLSQARTVAVGDEVAVAMPGAQRVSEAVTAVAEHKAGGLYNPHTIDGRLVVNGIVTSCVTDAVPQPIAAALLAPFKAAYVTVGAGPILKIVNEAVLVALARISARDVRVARAVHSLAGNFKVQAEL
jgi:hypothetical protein